MYSIFFNLNVKDAALALAASKFAAVLHAGVLLPNAIEIIAAETADGRMKRILTACAHRISDGYTFAEALALHRGIPEVFIETVRVGEENGQLTETFDYLNAYYSSRNNMKKKLYAAERYPKFLACLSAVTVWMVIVYLVPIMTSVFTAADTRMPLPMRILIAVSQFFSSNWWCAAIIIIAFIIVWQILRRTRCGAMMISKLKLHLPIVGKISRLAAAGQFAHTAAMLTSAGLALPDVMRIAGRVIDNRAVGEEIELAAHSIESGECLGCVLCTSKYLPHMICEMVTVGEESGTLETAMSIAGDYCNAEAMAISDRALMMLEPTLTVIMGLFVAFIVISIYVSIFSMYDAIGLFL